MMDPIQQKKQREKRDKLEKDDVFSRGEIEKTQELDQMRLDDDGMSNQRYAPDPEHFRKKYDNEIDQSLS